MKRWIVSAISITAALVLLSGCVSASAGGAVAGSSASTAAEAQSPTPTPTVAPTNVPADPSTWIVDYDSVAGVTVGQSLKALASAASLKPITDTIDCPPGYTGRAADGSLADISLMYPEARGSAIADPPFTMALISTNSAPDAVVASSPSTAAGIRLGSSEADLLAAYPAIQKTISKYDDSMGFTTYAAGPVDGRYLTFQVGPSASGSRTVRTIQSSRLSIVIDVCD